MSTQKFEITNAQYEEEVGGIVHAKIGNLTKIFTVQLTGGEYLSQMGCWIIIDGYSEDINFEIDCPAFTDFEPEIIKAAENAHEKYVSEKLQDGVWSDIGEMGCQTVSATSSTSKIVQELDNFDESLHDYKYRVVTNNSGFTQPNDYSQMPDFKIWHFRNLDAAITYASI